LLLAFLVLVDTDELRVFVFVPWEVGGLPADWWFLLRVDVVDGVLVLSISFGAFCVLVMFGLW
jgi:hypothetical protein